VVWTQPVASMVSVTESVPGELVYGPQVTVTSLVFALATAVAPVTVHE